MALLNLGEAAAFADDSQNARRVLHKSLLLAEEVIYPLYEASALINLGIVGLLEGHLKKAPLSSTGRCNTGHGSVSIGRWLIGTDGTTGVDGRAEEGVVGAVEGWGVAQRYRQGAQQTARLNPRGRCIKRGIRPRGKTPLAQSAVA